MNIVRMQNNAGVGAAHTSMSSSMTDYCHQGSRPDTLLPRMRKYPDQEGANLWSPCSNCSSDENNSPTALNSFDWDKPSLGEKSVDFGWPPSKGNIHETQKFESKTNRSNELGKRSHSSGYVNVTSESNEKLSVSTSKAEANSLCESSQSSSSTCISSLEECTASNEAILESVEARIHSQMPSFSSCDSFSHSSEETESMASKIQEEMEDLRNASWFQAGIPREIALEVLAEKPEGCFIVRESTTKPGCYALSLRVPLDKNESGIAHYLILHTNKGYKIKGFTKEFRTLSALITHHSVMPELLPCTLDLSRNHSRDAEREFEEMEQKTCDIFSDIHWVMTDLKL